MKKLQFVRRLVLVNLLSFLLVIIYSCGGKQEPPQKEKNAFRTAESIDPTLKIHSPIGGSLDQRSVELGQSVNALQMLARVLDISHVLVRGYVSPEDAQYINKGDSVRIFRRQNDPLEMK